VGLVQVRIALVTEFFYPHLGGVTEHVANLYRQFKRAGHVALIVTANMAGQPTDEQNVVRVGRSQVIFSNGSFARITLGMRLKARLRDVFRRERIDLVHVHGPLVPTLGLVAAEAATALDIPVVGTFHSWFPRSIGNRVFRAPLQRRLDRMAATIAVGQPVVDAHSRYFSANWEIIPNGVNVDYFHPNGRSPFSALHDAPRVLFLGRLDPRNGLDTMLAAMPAILARFPSTQLTVVGDGPLRARYETHARALGSHVRFVGSVYDERNDFYGATDVYVCPTTRASFGITLLEAMAAGRPMVVSDITGFRELVAGTDAAVRVPPGDPAAWADAVMATLGDPARRVAMGDAGRRAALTYAWPIVARRVLDVYERVTR
jgi:phosphatidylinositol alpha-mannosyltransferase